MTLQFLKLRATEIRFEATKLCSSLKIVHNSSNDGVHSLQSVRDLPIGTVFRFHFFLLVHFQSRESLKRPNEELMPCHAIYNI